MLTAGTTLIVIIVVFAIVLFLARRLLRVAIKLALIGAIIIALFAGGIFAWWRGWFDLNSRTQVPVRQTNRHANVNARPSR